MKTKNDRGNFKYNPIGKSFSNQNYDDINNSSQKFYDEYFVPDDESIFSTNPKIQNLSNIQIPSFIKKSTSVPLLSQFSLIDRNKEYKWKRLSELFESTEIGIYNENKKKKNLISDVVQGHIGDCYFMSVLYALANKVERIKKIIPNKNISKNGVFQVLVYLHGLPINVCIDDYFPIFENGDDEELAFAGVNPETNNIWPIILEKVWAKCNNSYEDIIYGNSSDVFQFLTPCPYDIYAHSNNTDNLFEIIQNAIESNFIVLAEITDVENTLFQSLSEFGLITNHAYSVIDTVVLDDDDKNKYKLIKLKNPWFTNEWLGDWSDDSKLWTDRLKKQANFEYKEKDEFYISFDDYIRFYTTTHICHIHDDYNYNATKILVDNDHPFSISSINIDKDTKGYFEVNLKNSRIYSNLKGIENFTNPYCSMIVFKNENNKFIYIGSDSGIKDRLYVECDNMQKGTYYIAVSFPRKNTQFKISENYEYNIFDKMSYRLGLYSPISKIDINVEEDISTFTDFLEDIISYLAKNNEDKYYFIKEGEKDSYRVINFDDDKKGFGYIYYNNKSDAYIHERLRITKLDNVNIYPLLKDGNFKKPDESKEDEIEFEDTYIQQDINTFREKTELQSNISMIKSVGTYEKIKEDNPLEIDLKIAPNSKCIILLQKTDDDSLIDFTSDICLEYLVDSLLAEKIFKSKKFMLKYNDKKVSIFECVTEHNTGTLFQYKNKTRNLNLSLTITFSKLINLMVEDKSDSVSVSKDNKTVSVSLEVSPGQTKYFSVKANNVFDEFNYSCKIDYHFSFAKIENKDTDIN